MKPWLIQRLTEKPKNERHAQVAQVFSFGAGGSGMSEDAWKAVQSVVDLDYMGSAEFEFGAFAKCLHAIVKAHQDYSCWVMEVTGKQIKRGVAEMPRWTNATQTIRAAAWLCEVQLDLKADKGFLFETLYFEVVGTPVRIAMFIQQIKAALPIQANS